MKSKEYRYFVYNNGVLKFTLSANLFNQVRLSNHEKFKAGSENSFEIVNAPDGLAIYDSERADLRVILWNGDIIKEIICEK